MNRAILPPPPLPEQIVVEPPPFDAQAAYDLLDMEYFMPPFEKLPHSEIRAASERQRTLPSYNTLRVIKAVVLCHVGHKWGDFDHFSIKQHDPLQILTRLNIFIATKGRAILPLPRWNHEPPLLWVIICCLQFDSGNVTGYLDGGIVVDGTVPPAGFLHLLQECKNQAQIWLQQRSFNLELHPGMRPWYTKVSDSIRKIRRKRWDLTQLNPADLIDQPKIRAINIAIENYLRTYNRFLTHIANRMYKLTIDMHHLQLHVARADIELKFRLIHDIDPFAEPHMYNLLTPAHSGANQANHLLNIWEIMTRRVRNFIAVKTLDSIPANTRPEENYVLQQAVNRHDPADHALNPLYHFIRPWATPDQLENLAQRRLECLNAKGWLTSPAGKEVTQPNMLDYVVAHRRSYINLVHPPPPFRMLFPQNIVPEDLGT